MYMIMIVYKNDKLSHKICCLIKNRFQRIINISRESYSRFFKDGTSAEAGEFDVLKLFNLNKCSDRSKKVCLPLFDYD